MNGSDMILVVGGFVVGLVGAIAGNAPVGIVGAGACLTGFMGYRIDWTVKMHENRRHRRRKKKPNAESPKQKM